MTPIEYYDKGYEVDLNRLLGNLTRLGARLLVSNFTADGVAAQPGGLKERFREMPLRSRVRFLLVLHFWVVLDQAVEASAPPPVWSGFDQKAQVPKLAMPGSARNLPTRPFELLNTATHWAKEIEPESTADLEAFAIHFVNTCREFLTTRLPSLLPLPSPIESRRIAENIIDRMESGYPRSDTASLATRWGKLIRNHLQKLRLPPVATIRDLPYVDARHAFVSTLEDYIDHKRCLLPNGTENLAEALRDIVRAVEGDVDPREAMGWINRALGRPIVVSKEQLHDAIRWGCAQRWLSWSGGLIRRANFAHRTAMAAATRPAPPSTMVQPTRTHQPVIVPTPPPLSTPPTRQGGPSSTRTVAPTATAQATSAATSSGTRVPAPETTRHRSTRTLADEPIVSGHAGPELAVGMVLEGERHWRVLRQAGQGGMGRVWEARAIHPPETHVAVKTVSAPSDVNRAALDRELRLLRTLQRADYFPVIHDAFTASGHLHLVMDWVPGRTLDAWVLDPGAQKVDVDRFFLWMDRVADRLAFLHAWPGRPILFRDLKPSNIMYDEETASLRLVDFGIGHLASPDGGGAVRAGTEGFMAPEVRAGTIDVRTDIFALGRLGLFLLFGRYDFATLSAESRPLDMETRRLNQALVKACFQLCHPAPHMRPSTVLAALRHLKLASSQQDVLNEPADACPTCGRSRLRSRNFCPGCGEARRVVGEEGEPPAVLFEHATPPPRPAGALPARVARAYEEFLAIRASADLNSLRCLASIDVEPYEYQRNAALHVIGQMGGRAMIADDVGLGKTIEAGLVMKEYLHRGLARRTLLVAPPGLLLAQLCDELRRKFKIDVREYRSNGDGLDQRFYVGPGGLEAADHAAVSLRTLSREPTTTRFASLPWDVVVVDECHHIKSPRSKGYRAVRKLVAPYTLFMSATPFSGKHEELWAVYSALRPGALGEQARFVSDMDRGRGDVHQQTIRGMTIRRRRAEMQVRFPGREARRLTARMTEIERQRYLAVVDAAQDTGLGSLAWIQPVLQVSASYEAVQASEAFHRFPLALQRDLERLTDADHPKVKAFLERFVDRLPRGEKTLVFTHYKASQAAILRLLRGRGRNAEGLLDASPQRRQELLAWFRQDPHAEFLVCGKGAGEGLNLQFCGLLVNLDLPWNPMQLEQRIGRVQRLGQPRRKVAIVNAVLAGTIEDRVLEIMEKKLRMFQSTLGDTEQILGGMFSEEGQSFESWVAAAILPDGTLRPEHRDDFDRRMTESDIRVGAARGAAGFVDHLLGLGNADGQGGAGIRAPTEAPVSLDFLRDI